MTTSTMKSYLKPSFIICVMLLLAAAVAKEAVIRVLGVQMVKKPIPLQHPLDEMNPAALAPYELKAKQRIQNRDVLESLGTEEYMQWVLEDAQAEPASPVRFCSVFITYYTGTPDMVPHVPDECYVGGGNVRDRAATLTMNVPVVETKKIGYQYVVFKNIDTKSMAEETFSVQYFFHANGKYCAGRTDTRLVLGSNWFSPYSYFCKVEWKFYGMDAFGMIYPDQARTEQATEKLMAVLLPELEAAHWPDWEAANEGGPSTDDEKQVVQ